MTSQPVPAPSDPRQLLAATQDLIRRVRREQRGAWFPLLVFAVVTFAATPFDRYGGYHATHCAYIRDSHGTGDVCTRYSASAQWYWPVALMLAYAAISWFYLHRSHRLGIGTRVRPYLLAGVALLLLVTAFGVWADAHPVFRIESIGQYGPPAVLLYRVANPACAIGLALLLLAWIERSRALLAVTCVYLVIASASVNLHEASTHPSPWSFLPHLLTEGGVLLLGGAVLTLVQRVQGRPTS